ncbi:MAG TPA: amidohydrolase family protein [Acidothermaceae bacterium]|nr:amidohydrolase family protein [Acidothermaceae bacterium]
MDGTGAAPFHGHVAVDGEKIVGVGELTDAGASRVIDASGRIVCPGFVDPHSHSDFTILTNPTAESTIRQGVTTEVVGNCGLTYAPVSALSSPLIAGRLRTFAYHGPVEWESFADYMSLLSQIGHSQNLAWFVGHNTIRWAAGVFEPQATEEQLRTMERYVAEAMLAGALGLSTGLEFNPGRAAPTNEIVRLNRVVGRYEGYYASHVRNRDAHLQESIDEFLTILRGGGTRGQISHLNVRNRTGAAPGAWERAVDTMARAREEGLDVLADTTPFRDGLGQMAGILPPWVLADGWQYACDRLRDPRVRESLRGECDRYWRFIHRGEWDRVRLQASPGYPGLDGKDFNEIAALLGRDQWDCYFDILADAGPGIESIMLIGELFTDEHLAEMISHPLFCLGVDGYTAALGGDLEGVAGHPVCFAGHVHYLTHHVGEAHTLPIEEAIRKMTSMPARHFGLSDRGELRPGMAADLVVLDLERLDDGSTLEQPLAYARGIDEVFVNGVAVVSGNEHTGARPGRHLARA